MKSRLYRVRHSVLRLLAACLASISQPTSSSVLFVLFALVRQLIKIWASKLSSCAVSCTSANGKTVQRQSSSLIHLYPFTIYIRYLTAFGAIDVCNRHKDKITQLEYDGNNSKNGVSFVTAKTQNIQRSLKIERTKLEVKQQCKSFLDRPLCNENWHDPLPWQSCYATVHTFPHCERAWGILKESREQEVK